MQWRTLGRALVLVALLGMLWLVGWVGVAVAAPDAPAAGGERAASTAGPSAGTPAGTPAGTRAGTPARARPELTDTELTWLEHARPVLAYARAQALPLDIIVQPQPTPGETPVGMAYIDGRCKLVLSMRGNPEAQATLDRIDPGLRGPVVESIMAHELAHCWRHRQRQWGELPVGLEESAGLRKVSTDQADLLRDMWRTRREEGFADLVGLAWVKRHHPRHYAAVHAWHVQLRAHPPVHTGPHDTRVWVQLAADPARFRPAESLFEQVDELWLAGLVSGI